MTPSPEPSDILWKRPELWLPTAAFIATFATSLAVDPNFTGIYVASVVSLASGALIFGVWNAIRRMRGEPVRGVPGTERYVPAHVQWKVLLMLGVVFFGLREGALAPDFVLSFHQYTADRNVQTSTSSNVIGSKTGNAPELRFAGRPLRLSYSTCRGDAVVCRGFDNALPPKLREHEDPHVAPITLDISVNASTSCRIPLTKSGDIDLTAVADVHLVYRPGKDLLKHLDGNVPPMATKSLSMNATLNLHQEMLGPASCRTFKLTAGDHLARSLTQTLEKTLEQH
jgi:hypothetical protein